MVSGRTTYGNGMGNMCCTVGCSRCGVRERHGVGMRNVDGIHEEYAW